MASRPKATEAAGGKAEEAFARVTRGFASDSDVSFGRLTREQKLRRIVEDALVGCGYSEAYTPSFPVTAYTVALGSNGWLWSGWVVLGLITLGMVATRDT